MAMNTGGIGMSDTPHIVTVSGFGVWFDQPERTPIRSADLREQLANSRRYCGVIDVTILLHLVVCVRIARAWELDDDTVALVAAHDLHEAYIGDVPTRMKDVLPGWRPMEEAWEAHVHHALGLSVPARGTELRRVLKEVDEAALWTEMHCHHHPGLPLLERRASLTLLERRRPGWRPRCVRAFEGAPLRGQQWSYLVEALPVLAGPPFTTASGHEPVAALGGA